MSKTQMPENITVAQSTGDVVRTMVGKINQGFQHSREMEQDIPQQVEAAKTVLREETDTKLLEARTEVTTEIDTKLSALKTSDITNDSDFITGARVALERVSKTEDKATMEEASIGLDNEKFITPKVLKETVTGIQAEGVKIFVKGSLEYEVIPAEDITSYTLSEEIFKPSENDFLEVSHVGLDLMEGTNYSVVGNTVNFAYTVKASELLCFKVRKTSLSYLDLLNTPTIANNLETLLPGSILDARQGPVIAQKFLELTNAIAGIDVSWEGINNKPTSFPPSGHKHKVEEISGISYPVTSVAGRTGAVTLAKADVGLGSVNNWDASTAVNNASTTTYATASAVKTAYDRAESAFQSASSGKSAIANAITAKGVATSTTAEFATMANNIGKISKMGDYIGATGIYFTVSHSLTCKLLKTLTSTSYTEGTIYMTNAPFILLRGGQMPYEAYVSCDAEFLVSTYNNTSATISLGHAKRVGSGDSSWLYGTYFGIIYNFNRGNLRFYSTKSITWTGETNIYQIEYL